MNLNIIKTKGIEEMAEFISSSINKKLEEGKRVLFMITGGSSIPMEVLVAKKIKENFAGGLTVFLSDERFGPVGHADSNWFKLEAAGFEIKGAKLIPTLTGEKIEKDTENLKNILENELNKVDYKIGIFGVGVDSHTAGILPHTEALKSEDIVCTYKTDLFDRITITPKMIEMFDEAILCAMGEIKWEALEKFTKDAPLESEPVQILKKVPLLTIFTDKE